MATNVVKSAAIVFSLIGGLSGLLHAATYHVDGDNSAAGDGSALNPFQTIEAGLQKATQGDTVHVHKVDGRVQPGPGPVTWGHYLLNQSIAIETGETLEIDPGVVVKFKYLTNKETNPGILVNGCLKALGQPGEGQNSVYFTSERDNTVGASSFQGPAPSWGDWHHIQFNYSSDDACCLIRHAEVRYAGGRWRCCWALDPTEAVLITQANPTITDTIIRHTHGAAIKADLSSSPVLQRLRFWANTVNALHLTGGEIHDQRTWSNTDVVHYLDSTVTIKAGTGVLTMPAGLVVKFKPQPNTDANPSLVVDGRLHIEGTPERPVILTSARDDTAKADDGTDGDTDNNGPSSGSPGDWYHVLFGDSSEGCLVRNAEIRYAGGFWRCCWAHDPKEAILITSAEPTITDTIIRDTHGDAIKCNLSSSPDIRKVCLLNNTVNALHIIGGELHDQRTWRNTDIVYYLDSTVSIAAGTGELAMAAGLVVKFKPQPNTDANPSLVVNGCLRVLGAPGRPVILTSSRDDTAEVMDCTDGDTNNDGPSSGQPGDWYHIAFSDSSDDARCLIEHAEIRYAGGYWRCCWAHDAKEAVLLTSASPTIRSVEFAEYRAYPIAMDLESFPNLSALRADTSRAEGKNAVHIAGGTIYAGGTWSNPGIPYYLDTSVTVAPGETLGIAPATVLKFKVLDEIGLYFDRSKLDARQVAHTPIVFTSIGDDDVAGDTNNDGPSDGQPGDWGQIRLANIGGFDVGIRHATFRFAGNGKGNATIPALALDFCEGEFLNCSFEECKGAGILAGGASTADIREILTKRTGVGVHLAGGSLAVLAGWTSFQDHTALLIDGADAQVHNSILSYYSFGSQDGYGVRTLGNSSLTICDCDVWSPWGTPYSTPPGDQTGVCGNVSQNPRFKDIYTDNLCLAGNSPCRDAGSTTDAVYYECTTSAAGTNRTIWVESDCAAQMLVSDWIEHDNDGTLRRISDVVVASGKVAFAPALAAPSQTGVVVKVYGPGDLYLHPRICGDDVDMGVCEHCPTFDQDECLPTSHPDYDKWDAAGKPNCWCGHYATPPHECQCHGDADGKAQGSEKTGVFYVGTSDLNALIACWLLKEPPHGPGIASIPNGICVDFDHKAQGSAKTGIMRVGTDDLNILIANWLVKEPPHGPGIPADCGIAP